MALTLNCETNKVITLDEYKQHVNEHVDISDPESVCASADSLKALANNRTFLTEYLNREMINWQSWQLDNQYTAQTLLLGGGRDFVIRANIWMPPPADPIAREEQKRLFLYDVPHDHNFSFLTVGYVGSGYETTIYEYDPSRVQGEVGEKVKLHFLETTTLPQGKLMFYRECTDVHTQSYPQDFSISLNLLLSSRSAIQRDQYTFDIGSSSITSHVRNALSSHVMVCRLARYVGNSETASLLEELARTHKCSRVRLAAVESLCALEPASSEFVWKRATDDPCSQVRQHAKCQLGN